MGKFKVVIPPPLNSKDFYFDEALGVELKFRPPSETRSKVVPKNVSQERNYKKKDLEVF